MLHGTKVINTLVGGPAFGYLMEGDIILKIDGQEVSIEDVSIYIRGHDIPGSKVTFTVLRRKAQACVDNEADPKSPYSPDIYSEDGNLDELEISITRVATAEIADRKRMFDLLTFSKVDLLVKLTSASA